MEAGIVLIVDDDDDIRELYADAFELADFHVLKATNGQEAIDLALEHHPSVILMDVTMPEMDGHEAVERIRNDAWGRHAKIMYLTNLSDAKNIVHAVERKSDEYIVKANTDIQEVVKRAREIIYSVRSDRL